MKLMTKKNNKLHESTIGYFFIFLVTFFPMVIFAQDGFVTCTGLDCQFCHLVSTGQNVMEWLVIALAVVAALIFTYAGLVLVTSTGNQAAQVKARNVFSNVIIGYLIVLGGWLLVDTAFKMLVDPELMKEGGELGPWNRVECVFQPRPVTRVWNIPTADLSSWVQGPDGAIFHIDTGLPISEGAVADSAAMREGRELDWAEGDACDTSQMVQVSAFGSTVTVHRSVASSLQSVSADWQSRGGHSFYEIRSIACYNCRNVAGTGRRSAHAYGIACDINPVENPYGRTLVTDMEESRFYELFTSRGWGWGGNWRSVKDAMHFSKARHEGGDGMDIR